MTSVSVNTYAHSATYVADNIMKCLKDIVRLSGLDPAHFADNWETTLRGVRAWLASEHLEMVTLEIYNRKTDALITAWELEVSYGWGGGDGGFWTDTDLLRYHIQKSGVAPSDAKYRIIVKTKPGRPDVAGWSNASSRPTTGFVRQSLGSTIAHNGLGANTAYWRKL